MEIKNLWLNQEPSASLQVPGSFLGHQRILNSPRVLSPHKVPGPHRVLGLCRSWVLIGSLVLIGPWSSGSWVLGPVFTVCLSNFMSFDFIFKFFLLQCKKIYTLKLIATLNFSLLPHGICFQSCFSFLL